LISASLDCKKDLVGNGSDSAAMVRL